MGASAFVPALLTLGRTSAIATAFEVLAQRLDPDRLAPGHATVVRIPYDAVGDEPPLEGESYTIFLPQKAPSAEAWYNSPIVRQYRQQPPEETR